MVHHEHMTSPPRTEDGGRFIAAMVAAAVVLAVVGSAVATAYDRGTAMFADTLSFALVVAVVAVVGAIVTLTVPGNRVGWLLLSAATVLGIGTAFTEAGIHGVVTAPGSVPGAGYLAALGPGLQAVGLVIAVVAVPVVFPDGRLPGTRWRWLAWSAIAGIIFLFLGNVLAPHTQEAGWPAGTARSACRFVTGKSPMRSPAPRSCSRWGRPPEPSPALSPGGGAEVRWPGSSCCSWLWPSCRPCWYFSPY